jgi:hypothetical protein
MGTRCARSHGRSPSIDSSARVLRRRVSRFTLSWRSRFRGVACFDQSVYICVSLDCLAVNCHNPIKIRSA